MAEPSDSSLAFFSKATPKQWRFAYELRPEVLKLKADQRSSKKGGPEEFIKLDTWFREKLPQNIHSRKDPHVLYEELVQIAKWRLMMGKYRPKMLDLVRINTETSVVNITRKAFKKLQQQKTLQQAITQLVNLKGIGPSTASAVLAAAYPEEAPFMSDEGMLSTPGVEATDSTIAEYINYSDQLRNKTEALRQADPEYKWTPHKVDQVLWIYYLAKDLKPVLLEAMPRGDSNDNECSVTNNKTNNQLSDAVDDNANVMAPTSTMTNTTTTTLRHHHHIDHHLDHDEESSTSQDVMLNESMSSLNGASFMNEDSESASVPYSEDGDISSQGGASCSVDSTAATIGSDISSANITTTTNTSTTMGATSVLLAPPPTIQLNGNGTPNGSATSTNTNNGSASGLVVEDSQSNLSEDQDSRSGLSSSGLGVNDEQILPVNNNTPIINTPLTPSEENSVDNVDEVSLDDAPPMKKQKTGLELSQALAAATAEPTGAEA